MPGACGINRFAASRTLADATSGGSARDAVLTAKTSGLIASALAIALGAIATATVSPADGALGVLVTSQVEIQVSAPLNASTVIPDNVRLVKVSDSLPVTVRLLVSGSRKTLAVVPVASLEPETAYRLEASNLAGESETTWATLRVKVVEPTPGLAGTIPH